MSDHSEASHGSKHMCQKLFDCLAERIPNLKQSQSKNWCSGDVENLRNESRIEVIPREEFKSGWEEKFPARFYVKGDSDIDPACDLLYKVSYPAS